VPPAREGLDFDKDSHDKFEEGIDAHIASLQEFKRSIRSKHQHAPGQ
jgi:hypothetical protein